MINYRLSLLNLKKELLYRRFEVTDWISYLFRKSYYRIFTKNVVIYELLRSSIRIVLSWNVVVKFTIIITIIIIIIIKCIWICRPTRIWYYKLVSIILCIYHFVLHVAKQQTMCFRIIFHNCMYGTWLCPDTRNFTIHFILSRNIFRR